MGLASPIREGVTAQKRVSEGFKGVNWGPVTCHRGNASQAMCNIGIISPARSDTQGCPGVLDPGCRGKILKELSY